MSSPLPLTVLITGCSATSIGSSLALAFALHASSSPPSSSCPKFHVFATARNLSKIPAQLSELGNVTVLELDVTSGKSVREAVRDVERHPLVVEKRRRRMMMLCGKEREESDGDKEEEKHKTTKGAEGRGLALGGLDILINNAGMLSFMPLLDINFGDNEHGSCSDGGEERIARKVFEVNFWGALRVIRGFRGLLVKDFPPAGGGKGKDGDGEDNDERKVMVVNVSSMAGEVGVPWMGIYSASKAALTHLSSILAHELSPLNITVQTLTAGMILSGLTNNAPDFHLPEGSFYKPIEGFIVQRTKMEDEAKWGTERKKFAEGVVRDVVAGRGGVIRKGAFAGGLAWGRRWLGGWVMDWLITRGSGLSELGVLRMARRE